MDELKQLQNRVQKYGARVLEKRLARLEGRKFVLFPFLRARMLLRRIRVLMGA
jgi:hypothetical protein